MPHHMHKINFVTKINLDISLNCFESLYACPNTCTGPHTLARYFSSSRKTNFSLIKTQQTPIMHVHTKFNYEYMLQNNFECRLCRYSQQNVREIRSTLPLGIPFIFVITLFIFVRKLPLSLKCAPNVTSIPFYKNT